MPKGYRVRKKSIVEPIKAHIENNESICFFGNKDRLGHAIGKGMRTSIALLNEGFGNNIKGHKKKDIKKERLRAHVTNESLLTSHPPQLIAG